MRRGDVLRIDLTTIMYINKLTNCLGYIITRSLTLSIPA